MKVRELHRMEKLIGGTRTAQDIWKGKKPCWELCVCPRFFRKDCPATMRRSALCWAGARGKAGELRGRTGSAAIRRELCTHARFAVSVPLRIRVLGRGMNVAFYLVRAGSEADAVLN